jgi:hypothetical protein
MAVKTCGPSVLPPSYPVLDRTTEIGSGRSAKIKEHLSAALRVKNRFAQRGQGVCCGDWRLDRAGSDERDSLAQRRGYPWHYVGMAEEEAFGDDALEDQVERVDCNWPSAHAGIDNKGPMRAERAGD